ncbi:MAG: hypothetical protein KDA85_21705 [Planctomycetaceae bacterium]|nr:hypothetical protein [Planctomycetaceae bacterium]
MRFSAGCLLTMILLTTTLVSPVISAPKVIKVGTKPESVCRGFGNLLYVTMINGEEPGDGGINVIDGESVREFCRGMNSPKGIAFVGDHLVVADETTVWKVDAAGKAVKLAEKASFPAPIEFLNDVAASLDNSSVYVTEMSNPGWMFDPDGERQLWPVDSDQAVPPGTACVYRVTLDGKVSLAVPSGDPLMPGPNGVTVTGTPDHEVLVMGDFFTGNIVSWDGSQFELLGTGMRGADGVTVRGHNLYVSSWPLGKVWKYNRDSKQLTVLAENFTTAADFWFDDQTKQLIIPDMLEGTLTFLPLE